MIEAYSEPLPDVKPYFERLCIIDHGQRDLAFLNEIIRAHQCRIPFENLAMCDEKTPLSLTTADLFEKVIRKKRGGCCYELNGLCSQFLKDIGYDAAPCMVRIVRGRDCLWPVSHCGMIVRLEEKDYYCDVGYGGPQPPGAVLVQDREITKFHGEAWKDNRLDEWRHELTRIDAAGNEEKIFRFYPMPQYRMDFIAIAEKSCSDPAGFFMQNRLVSIRTEDGRRSLFNRELTIHENGEKHVLAAENENDLRAILKDTFGIETCRIRF
ncbi:MAG: arylamine N-acetyltransferase [Desulfovibrionaceae bacterium]|nr:arylamine N-acetyltransferase [Desulfovibrionaceae bacterium]